LTSVSEFFVSLLISFSYLDVYFLTHRLCAGNSGVIDNPSATSHTEEARVAKKQSRGGRGGRGRLGNVAVGLGRILGQAEAQWRGQREAMARALTAVRDKASALLAEMGSSEAPRPRTGRVRKAPAATPPTVKKVGRRKFTAAQKAETSRRMKAYWAARRKAEAKGKKGKSAGDQGAG